MSRGWTPRPAVSIREILATEHINSAAASSIDRPASIRRARNRAASSHRRAVGLKLLSGNAGLLSRARSSGLDGTTTTAQHIYGQPRWHLPLAVCKPQYTDGVCE